ncbi:MAG: RHS repeat-associated core domain-containing protein, partial [Planctomycetes bacterium]|nr:RHS repeat-associated core domain-containing protein [Planctomycetota bacterium]
DSGTAGEYAGLDRFGRVVDHLWYDYGASADRDRFTYGYDRASSRLYRENTVASAKDEYYTYDEVNRLATFDRGDLNANKDAISGTPVKEEDWGLDMTGNWTDFLQKTSGTTDLNQDRSHNPVNEITGITETTGTAWIDPVHDRAGNMTTLPKPSSLASGLTCKWDAWNRLVEVKDGATVVAVYEYDGLARRVKSHVDSQSPGNPDGVDAYVHFFYNQGWQELESRVSTSENTEPESLQPQYQYVWSQRFIDAPILRDKNTDTDSLCDDERLYYLGDANFNITTLIDTSGDALERYVYTPYGVLTIYDATWSNVRSTSTYSNSYTYTGRYLDAETGLYCYRHRVYAAHLGRFVSRDPIGYAGGGDLYRGHFVPRGVDPSGTTSLIPWQPSLPPPAIHQACCTFSHGSSTWTETVTHAVSITGTILSPHEICQRRAYGYAILVASRANSCSVLSTQQFYICSRPVYKERLGPCDRAIATACNASHVDIGVDIGGRIATVRHGRGGGGACTDPRRRLCPLYVKTGWFASLRYPESLNGTSCKDATSADIAACLRSAPQKPGPFNDLTNNCQIDVWRAAESCCLETGGCNSVIPTVIFDGTLIDLVW